MTTFNVSSLPTVNLACMVIYDAFVMRGLRENGVRLPEEKAGHIVHETIGQSLASGFPDGFAMVDTIRESLGRSFVQHPPASVKESGYVACSREILARPLGAGVGRCLPRSTARSGVIGRNLCHHR